MLRKSNECAFTQNVNKKVTRFFFNFEILKQQCEYPETVKLDLNSRVHHFYFEGNYKLVRKSVFLCLKVAQLEAR